MVVQGAPHDKNQPETGCRTPEGGQGDETVRMSFVHLLAVAVGKGGNDNPVMVAVVIVFMTTVLVVVLVAMWRWWRG